VIQEKPEKENGTKLPKPLETRPPFPKRLAKSKKDREDKEILENFRKVEVNTPLLDAIIQISRYAKFLKELCVNKKKLTGYEKVSVGENISTIIQRKLPSKYKDQGMFAISCKIGNVGIKRVMFNLGASINVMPRSIFTSLNVRLLKETGVVIQLTNMSIVYPKGALEDILV
jgi:hypothetical protein